MAIDNESQSKRVTSSDAFGAAPAEAGGKSRAFHGMLRPRRQSGRLAASEQRTCCAEPARALPAPMDEQALLERSYCDNRITDSS
jgi:hypothetical protein